MNEPLNSGTWMESTGPISAKSIDIDLDQITLFKKYPLNCLIQEHPANYGGVTAGGLLVQTNWPAMYGTVVISPADPHYHDELPVGAVVLYERYAGEPIIIRGKTYYVIHSGAIVARHFGLEHAA